MARPNPLALGGAALLMTQVNPGSLYRCGKGLRAPPFLVACRPARAAADAEGLGEQAGAQWRQAPRAPEGRLAAAHASRHKEKGQGQARQGSSAATPVLLPPHNAWQFPVTDRAPLGTVSRLRLSLSLSMPQVINNCSAQTIRVRNSHGVIPCVRKVESDNIVNFVIYV